MWRGESNGRLVELVGVAQPIVRCGLDGSSLIARDGITGGSQLALNASTSGDYNTQIGIELPAFVDGPSIYAYAKSMPS